MIDVMFGSLSYTYENTVGEVGSLRITNGTVSVPIFTVKDCAVILGLSPRSIRRKIDEGELIGTKIGRVWYVQLQSLSSVGERLDKFPF